MEFVFFDSLAMRDRYGRLLSPNQNPFMRKKILPFGQHDAFETALLFSHRSSLGFPE